MSSPDTSVSPALLTPDAAGIERAAELLKSGRLVVLPTETVYGIALSLLSPEARSTAQRVRQRASDAPPSPWVIHVGRVEDLLAWAPSISAVGRRLVTKLLPGPVAFQIKLDGADLAAAQGRLGPAADETIADGFLTLRCPDCQPTQDVLSRASAGGPHDPVAIIGAGTAARPGVYETADLPESLLETGKEGVAAVLDGGATRYRKPSTLVRIAGETFSVVRAGVIDGRIVDRMADFVVLFLCTGNTCRSPMASALAGKLIADKLGVTPAELSRRHVVVQSAGLHASRGMRATMEAVDAVKERGASLAGHISQPATSELLRRADVIYTMTDAHREEVLDLYPWAERKTFRLDPEGDVADPVGAPLGVYQSVARRLEQVLQRRLIELPV